MILKGLQLVLICCCVVYPSVTGSSVVSDTVGSGDQTSLIPLEQTAVLTPTATLGSGLETLTPDSTPTPTISPQKFMFNGLFVLAVVQTSNSSIGRRNVAQRAVSSSTFDQSLFVQHCVDALNSICQGANSASCGGNTPFSITAAEVSIAVAEVKGNSPVPSNFPLANAFPFIITITGENPAYFIVVNFLYPSGVAAGSTILPLGVTVQALRNATATFAAATGFRVLFVDGIDLSFFYRNRLILAITIPVAVIVFCLICVICIGILICCCKKNKKKGKVGPGIGRKDSNSSDVSDVLRLKK